MEFIITPLGARGWMGRDGRETACMLAQVAGQNFLLDFGTGASRLLESAIERTLGDRPLNICLSHYHLDHVVGLSYFPGILKEFTGVRRLITPGKELVTWGFKDACERLLNPPLTSHGPERLHAFEFLECGPEGILLDGVRISMYPQVHPGGSVSIRIGDWICYSTDLAPDTGELVAARGVKCLIHEVWSLEPEPHEGVHSDLSHALEHTRQSGARHLVPVHFGPRMKEEDIRSLQNYSSEDFKVWTPIEPQRLTLE
jgi:ribonuclease BN (tRNA processing enzyme)